MRIKKNVLYMRVNVIQLVWWNVIYIIHKVEASTSKSSHYQKYWILKDITVERGGKNMLYHRLTFSINPHHSYVNVRYI